MRGSIVGCKRRTSGSQFFIVTGPGAAQLPHNYALLGNVTEGENVVDRIGAIATDQIPAAREPDRVHVDLNSASAEDPE
jgi:cyclophilin family peptidyl-prolyl cis-trans isomerase